MMGDGWTSPTPSSQIMCGCSEDIFYDPEGLPFSLYQECFWGFKQYPHALLIGGTGSGKTVALKRLIALFLSSMTDCELFLCTFKNKNDDFPYLVENLHFAGFSRCNTLFDTFYDRFTARLEGRDSSRELLLLGFDEWAGFLLSFDKKEQESVLAKMGQILMMGRALNVQILVALQRPDAIFFRNGARDNFGLIIALGNLSSEGGRMVFSSSFAEQIQPCGKIGMGYMLVGGVDFYRIRVPPPVDEIDRIIERKLIL